MSTAIAYNERKVSRGEADVVCRVNMDSDADSAVRETFARYERLNIRSTEVCFHMSVNPGEGEYLEEGRAKELISGLMESLGYGAQPYVIYRHHDIERGHFHVLSIRTNDRGRKIPSFQENRRCQRFLEEASKKYGFVKGSEAAREMALEGINPRLFVSGAGNVSAQMDAVFGECLKYHFKSEREFSLIMRDHGLLVKQTRRRMYVQGMNREGETCTPPVAKEDYMSRMLDRMQECMGEDLSKAAHRVARTGATLLPYSTSQAHYENMMLRKGVHLVLERDSKGKVFGALFIDHESRSAFSIAELGHEMSLSMIQEADSRRWSHSEEQRSRINIGEYLFSSGNQSKGQEKDPRNRKKRKNQHY